MNRKRVRIDTRANIKIDSNLHEEMLKIAKEKGNTVTGEYEKIIKDYIKRHAEQQILKNSELEEMLDEKFNRIDKHLSSMLGRAGIDINMVLSGLLVGWAKEYELKEHEIYESIREHAVKLYKRKDT